MIVVIVCSVLAWPAGGLVFNPCMVLVVVVAMVMMTEKVKTNIYLRDHFLYDLFVLTLQVEWEGTWHIPTKSLRDSRSPWKSCLLHGLPITNRQEKAQMVI